MSHSFLIIVKKDEHVVEPGCDVGPDVTIHDSNLNLRAAGAAGHLWSSRIRPGLPRRVPQLGRPRAGQLTVGAQTHTLTGDKWDADRREKGQVVIYNNRTLKIIELNIHQTTT